MLAQVHAMVCGVDAILLRAADNNIRKVTS